MRSTRIRLAQCALHVVKYTKPITAEFRGPGVRRQYEDSGDDFDLDLDQRTRGLGGRSGRIILLGDGTEVLTDSDEHEIMDHEDEVEDLESHVVSGSGEGNRSQREGTPGPEPAKDSADQTKLETEPTTSSASNTTENSETPIKQAADEAPKEAAQ